jgi:hypothetical protein
MRPDDLREYLDQRPFHPVRLHLSSGAFFDIRQAEMAAVGRSTLTLGLPVEAGFQRFVVIALVHIVWLEVLLPSPCHRPGRHRSSGDVPRAHLDDLKDAGRGPR